MLFFQKYFNNKKLKKELINNISYNINFIFERYIYFILRLDELHVVIKNNVINTEIELILTQYEYLKHIFQKNKLDIIDMNKIDNFLISLIDLKNFHRFESNCIFQAYISLIIRSVSNIIYSKKQYIKKYLKKSLINIIF